MKKSPQKVELDDDEDEDDAGKKKNNNLIIVTFLDEIWPLFFNDISKSGFLFVTNTIINFAISFSLDFLDINFT